MFLILQLLLVSCLIVEFISRLAMLKLYLFGLYLSMLPCIIARQYYNWLYSLMDRHDDGI